METLSAYLPLDRYNALTNGRTLPDRTEGAALFADISGFTPLTEALVRSLGPRRGAEELTRCLSEVYDSLIAEVVRYGGSVIGFAGDAITCWFDGDTGLGATACGLAMQAAMRHFAALPLPSGDTATLAAKVSVAVGPARRFVVGAPEVQRIDALGGATIERMAAAEHLARTGEVVVDETCAARHGASLRIAEQRVEAETGRRFAAVAALARPVPPAPLPPGSPDNAAPDWLPSWLLPPVYERLASGQGEFLAELRPVVALFLGFSGLDYDKDDDAPQRLDAYVRWVQQTLLRYGGYLLQIIIGDKGSYLYASFGAPVAHDNDAARAVAAALDLVSLPADLGYIANTRIGVAEGRAFAGAYGATTRRTYGVIGDAVNLAARLMQNAPAEGVLVSEGIHNSARRAFAWESLAPITVKGKAEPVAVFLPYTLDRQRTMGWQEPRYTLPLVGREAERALIDQKLHAALKGHGHIIAITAEAGMGKSRLVAEVIQRCAEMGFDACGGECQSYGAQSSYLVWNGIWRSFFGLDDINGLDEQVAALERRLAAIDATLLPRLPLLGLALNLPLPDTELTRSLDAKLRKASLEALLVDCIRARAATAPLVIVLEDIHWIDPLSHDLLEVIGRVISDLPILLVVAYRPPELGGLQAPRVTQLPHCSVLELTSFTPDEAERLIELKLAQLVGGDERPSATLLERIAGRAQGNPFYIEELLNYLHDRGLDHADARVLEQLELPTSLHSLVLSRIDQLSESQKITLRVASIIGRQFRKSWLWGARPELGSPARVQADLDELSVLDLTPVDQPEPESIYLFKHIVTREAAYESLPYATRALLHGQLGQFIEDSYVEELDQYIDLLAYHYDQSSIVPKKRAYLRRAGEAAQAAYANEAAIDYYRRVLPLLSDDERVATLLTLGQVLELVGNWSEAGDCYRQALQRAEELDDQQAQASARRAMGWLLRKRGEYHEATSWLVEARAGYEQLGDLAAVSQVMTEIGEVARQLGAYTEAKKWYDDALSLAAAVAEREPRLMAQAQALKGAGTLANQQGDHAAARGLYEKSLAIRRDLGDRPGVAVMLNNLGIVTRHLGDYATALAMNEESLAVFREIGDRWTIGTLLNNLGCVAADMSDYTAARQILTESMEVRRQLGDQGGLAFSLNSLADVLLDEGDHVAARPLLEESVTINVNLGDRAAVAYLLDDFAALAASEDQPERAVRLAGAAAAANELLGTQLPAGERARFERLQAPARQALGEQRATMEWEQGRVLTLEQAVEYALARQTGTGRACD